MVLTTLTPTELLIPVMKDYLATTRLSEAPLLGILAAKAIKQEQSAIEWGATLADATASGRAVLGALSDDANGTTAKASLSIPDYYFKNQFTVSKRELINASNTGRITEVRNPVNRAMRDAMQAIVKNIQTALYNGVGTLDTTSYGVIGLTSIVGQSGTYATLPRTNSKWRSIQNVGATPGTPETFTIERYNKLKRDRRIAGASNTQGNGEELLILTNDEIETDVLRKIYPTLTTLNEDFNKMVRDIQPYTEYRVGGVPVISDPYCTANTMYLINLSKMELRYFDNSSIDEGSDKISYIPLRQDQEESPNALQDTGLQIRLADVSDENPDKFSFELSLSLQLVATDPVDSISVLKDVKHTYP